MRTWYRRIIRVRFVKSSRKPKNEEPFSLFHSHLHCSSLLIYSFLRSVFGINYFHFRSKNFKHNWIYRDISSRFPRNMDEMQSVWNGAINYLLLLSINLWKCFYVRMSIQLTAMQSCCFFQPAFTAECPIWLDVYSRFLMVLKWCPLFRCFIAFNISSQSFSQLIWLQLNNEISNPQQRWNSSNHLHISLCSSCSGCCCCCY